MTANSFDMSQGGDAGKVLFGLVCVVAIAWIYFNVQAAGCLTTYRTSLINA